MVAHLPLPSPPRHSPTLSLPPRAPTVSILQPPSPPPTPTRPSSVPPWRSTWSAEPDSPPYFPHGWTRVGTFLPMVDVLPSSSKQTPILAPSLSMDPIFPSHGAVQLPSPPCCSRAGGKDEEGAVGDLFLAATN
jgi:hypothetical protein